MKSAYTTQTVLSWRRGTTRCNPALCVAAIKRREIAPNHLANQLLARDFLRRNRVHESTVAKNGDLVGKGEYLVHAMTDVEKRDAFVAQTPKIREQSVGLACAPTVTPGAMSAMCALRF